MGNIDKNVVMLGWVSFFTDMASAMINPILPIFIVVALHQGVDKLGVVVAIATFVSYALRLFSGYISDRYGIVKPLVVGGYALSAISKPLIGFSHGYKSIAGLKALERVGKGLRSAPKDLMISAYSKTNASGKTFGFHKTMDIAGELSGTLILFGLLWFYGQSETVMRYIFYATLIPGIIGLLLLTVFVKDIRVNDVASSFEFAFTERDKVTSRSLIFYFLFIFFLFNEAFFTMQAQSVGIAISFIPLLFIVSTWIQTLVSYPIGLMIDRIGVRKVLLVAYSSGIVAQVLLLAQKPLLTWVAYGFLGLFTVSSLNANRAYISTNSDNRGSVYGFFYAGVALFGALGAFLCGLLWEHIGMSASLLFSLSGTVLLLFAYTFLGE